MNNHHIEILFATKLGFYFCFDKAAIKK